MVVRPSWPSATRWNCRNCQEPTDGNGFSDVFVRDQWQRQSPHDVDEEEERLVMHHDLLERPRPMVVEVRGSLVDAAKLWNIEAVEDLVAGDGLE